ncbi:MAG: hypothetical protein II752_00695 [Muribaculaceae bacterium]|nr:hypothetical protein [Muribaculaceae bacterium]
MNITGLPWQYARGDTWMLSSAIGSSAEAFATAGCLSGNTRFGISPSHYVGF